MTNPPSIRLINSTEMNVSSASNASNNIVDDGSIPGVDLAINSPPRIRQNQHSKRRLSKLLIMTMTTQNNIHAEDEYIEMGVSSISEDSPDPANNGSAPAVDVAIDFLPPSEVLSARLPRLSSC
jgi:hypothetical protein